MFERGFHIQITLAGRWPFLTHEKIDANPPLLCSNRYLIKYRSNVTDIMKNKLQNNENLKIYIITERKKNARTQLIGKDITKPWNSNGKDKI